MNLNNILCTLLWYLTFTLTYKCIFFKFCTQNFTDEDKLRTVSMDCDDDFLVTMSIDVSTYDRPGIPSVSTILVRELQSGEVVCIS
jgi:hypothetical protein